MSPRARHLQEMRLALAEGISLAEARHRLAELRLRAVREARAKAGRGGRDLPALHAPKSYWWESL